MKVLELLKNRKVQIALVIIAILIVAYLTRKRWMKPYASIFPVVNYDKQEVSGTVELQGVKFDLPIISSKNDVNDVPYTMDYSLSGHSFSITAGGIKLTEDRPCVEIMVFNKKSSEMNAMKATGVSLDDIFNKYMVLGIAVDFNNKKIYDIKKTNTANALVEYKA